VVPSSKIDNLWSAWSADELAVHTTAVPVDAGCGAISGNYVTDPANPNNHLIQSMLLSAMMGGKGVSLTIGGCSGVDPIIISVQVTP
jgi:hypothetical protein